MRPNVLRAQKAPYADVESVGIPRALLYYRYRVLWTTFFENLGRKVIVSNETNRATADAGDAHSVDECCLASKIYLGHVQSLAGSCDAIFVPSMANLGRLCGFCTKFQALPDVVRNTFASQNMRMISCLVDIAGTHTSMEQAFVELGTQFDAHPRQARHAFHDARRADEKAQRSAAHAQEQLLASSARMSKSRPLAILFVAHPYVAHDPAMGGLVADVLTSLGTIVLYADETDRGKSYQASLSFSKTMPWLVSRELIGATMMLHDRIDGIVLVSSFPCGPDSMTNDAILRCVQGKPILNLTIDGQTGAAGLETRIESFVDILRYQKKGGYLHGTS